MSGPEISVALRATVLLFIDRQPGEWLSVERIRQHVEVREERVRNVLQQLADTNQVQHARRDGVDLYGVRCEGFVVPGRAQP